MSEQRDPSGPRQPNTAYPGPAGPQQRPGRVGDGSGRRPAGALAVPRVFGGAGRRERADPSCWVSADGRPWSSRAAVPPMAGAAAVGAVVHLLVTAVEGGRDLSSMSGILADRSYRVLPA